MAFVRSLFVPVALFGAIALVIGAADAARAEPARSAPPPGSSLLLPMCGANEALAVRIDGTHVCKALTAIPAAPSADCSLGVVDDGPASCVARGTGQTDPYYATRREALARWLDGGAAPGPARALDPATRSAACTAFVKGLGETYRCETGPGPTSPPALPLLKCGAGQTVTFTPQRELRCIDLPAGRVVLPCTDFASGQTSRDGATIDCGPRNAGSVDEARLARTLDYLYRAVRGLPPHDDARPIKASLRTGRIPTCTEAQTLVWNGGALSCATRGAAAITRTDATLTKDVIERAIVKLLRHRPDPGDPFLPGAKLADTQAVVFLDGRR